MRFLHTADWQLGAPQHPQIYKEKTLPKLIEAAREHKVDFILCVGDIFDRPKPEQETKDSLLKAILDNPDILFIFTVGNHDYTTKTRRYHSLKYLQLLQSKLNVRVFEPGSYKQFFGDYALYVLDDNFQLPESMRLKPKMRSIVACHGILPGFSVEHVKQNEQTWNIVNTILRQTEGHYLALGDIHKHLALTDVCGYPGALVQKTYACEDGMFLVDLREDNIIVKSLRLDLPKKINLHVTFEEGKDSEEDIIAFVKENIRSGDLVRLVFQLPVEVWARVDKEYINEGTRDHVLEIKLDNDPVSKRRTRKNMDKVAEASSVEEELDVIIFEDAYGLERKRLKKTCKKYI